MCSSRFDMRVLLALVVFACACIGSALGQHALAQDSCSAENLDLGGLIRCRRSSEERRDQRCAAATPLRISPPTNGPRILNFGEKTQYGSTSKGVVFEGGGPTIDAPGAGRVLFAGTYRSYGNIVIIDSCNVDILVAGLNAIATHVEALVAVGQPIGNIAGAGGVVYLEVRRADRAIDPFGPLSD
jgi:septal ring factor EnvC (AmiA/AmiB activator)